MRYRFSYFPGHTSYRIIDPESNQDVTYVKDDILDVRNMMYVPGASRDEDILDVLNERTGYNHYIRRSDLNKWFEQITNDDATQYYLDLFQKMMEERSSDVLGHEMIEIGDAESIIETLLYDRELQIVPEEMIDMGYRVEDIH